MSTHAYLEFEGVGLDLERYVLAWRRVIDRHEMLRAVMDPVRNEQRILAEVPLFEPVVVDLRGVDAAGVEAGLLGVRERLSHEVRPADVWPLFEVVVSLLDGGRVRVHISVDALISDFASGRILFRELSRFYEDPDVELPVLGVSFRDYVLAEAAIEGTELWERSREYWWGRLGELPAAPDLPMVKDPGTVVFPRFVRHEARLDAGTWSRLKTRAAQSGLTPTGLLLAAYAETLASWSRTAHLTLNVPRINRLPLHPQVNEVMGEFASFTLLEVDNREREPFEVRARRLQERLWNDLSHQYVSGVRVLRELMRRQGGMDRALMPVVLTSTLALSRDERTALERELTPVHAISQTPQVWMDYQVEEREGALLFNWDVVEELFPEGMVGDMFAAHHTLLQNLADDDRLWSASDLRLLPQEQAERRALSAGPERPIEKALAQDFFLEQVGRRPDQVAVVTSGRSVTYRELRHEANQVAWWLRDQGVRPGSLVGIVMDKGWEQVVAAYGVLFSGAAYLPIDPGAPAERLVGLLERGEVRVVLTQSHLNTSLPWPEGIERLCLDQPLPDDLDGTAVPEPVRGGDDLAYALFTSGSTGQPKGVMIGHRGLVNALQETMREFRITDTDRALGLTALHHDMSLFDVFGVLGAGGTLVLPDAGRVRDAAHWAELIAAHGVTVWNSVPAMMEMLLEHVGSEDRALSSLRTVFLGGDWIPMSVPSRLSVVAPGAELVSVGGPTETTLWNIWYRVGELDSDWSSIPYGRPIANTRYHVLNERLEACPEWVTGEMYVAGVGLARGYWRDEERTAAAFVTHPVTGERLYRTGDLGRWRPEGVLEFMGRADFQVKIRGMRIELGEIETQLAAHPEVTNAVVVPVTHPDRPGYHALTAYLTTSHHGSARLTAAQAGDFTDTRMRRVALRDPLERAEFKLTQPGIRREPDRDRVPLLTPTTDDALVDRYLHRRSDRTFLDQPVGLQEFSDCLNCLYQIEVDGLPKYRYPSGGGLYPVQTYVYVAPGGVDGVPAGAYYYNAREGTLVLLDEHATVDRDIHAAHNHALFEASAFSLFFVGETAAVEPMYGDLARDLCLMESGYMGQLLMTWAADNEIGLCPVGDMDFRRITELFRLRDSHVFLHGMLGGRVDRTATRHIALDIADQETTVPQGTEIREWLRDRLPEHLIPASFILLDALPLTANGKVDRRNLPAPSLLADATGNEAVDARTPTESRLAAIWKDLLDVPQVGIHDNFFELGGQSIVATRLVARIRTEFQVEIALRDVFESRTVAGLALVIDQHRVAQSEYDHLPAPLPVVVDAAGERFAAFPVTDTQQAYLLGRSDAFELGNVSTHAYLEFEGVGLDLERYVLAWRRV
ncbi:non-ribosomal peptide synthetase, partial [Streptomyces hainanensis]|uniref:non-ribosomal peptide synthetase n=1 Tax=Streptomyces hainanensis TaxID=402648 RepID=UPI001404C188